MITENKTSSTEDVRPECKEGHSQDFQSFLLAGIEILSMGLRLRSGRASILYQEQGIEIQRGDIQQIRLDVRSAASADD